MSRKIILLTEGLTNPHNGKTARNLIYYKPEEVIAIFDRGEAGKTSGELLGVGNIPVVDTLDIRDEYGERANTLLIGVATAGGVIPASYKEIILEAIKMGMNIINGLHHFLEEDKEIAEAASKYNVHLTDVRKNTEKKVANREGIKEDCLRVHTIGNDCSVGKMIVSLEVNKALVAKGYDAKFCATGQTGILIEGDGVPIDAVVADFINGSAEQLVLRNQHHKILNIEGQGSLVHPRYSPVSLGLLHGTMPQAMILCYEMGRDYIAGMNGIKIPPLREVIKLYEHMASLMLESHVIGIAINSRKFTDDEADEERERVRNLLGLPVCDVIRHGPGELVDAIEKQLQKIQGK